MKIRHDILIKSGKCFDFDNLEKNEFSVEDIAHGLSNLCRFNGHTRQFYSVAQHSVMVSRIVPEEHSWEALFHDAAEAFIGDMPTPLKDMLPDYQALEKRVESFVFKRLGVAMTEDGKSWIKKADLIMLMTEQRDLMPQHDDKWSSIEKITPIARTIRPWPPEDAYMLFLNRVTYLQQYFSNKLSEQLSKWA